MVGTELYMIVAGSRKNDGPNGEARFVIGNEGNMPWPRLREDMKRFSELTTGYPVIMGRKTYLSLPEKVRPLKNRLNIILTRNPNSNFVVNDPLIRIYGSLDEAIDTLDAGQLKVEGIDTSKAWIMGGGQIYNQAMPFASKIYLTSIDGRYNGDTFLDLDTKQWNLDFDSLERVVQRKEGKIEEGFTFVTYDRR